MGAIKKPKESKKQISCCWSHPLLFCAPVGAVYFSLALQKKSRLANLVQSA